MARLDKALEKLPEVALKSLTQSADILAYARASNATAPVIADFKANINGYLICLMDLGILNQVDVRLLRIHFMQ